MRAPAAAGDDGLATEDERLLLAQLREHFADDLQRRTAEGRAHSCCFGDLALTRVLRGNDGDLAKATAWLARFLQRWDACDLDTMLRHLVQEWDRVGSPIPLDSMLPYYGEVQHFVRAVFTAPKPSPQGDLINYISLARFEMAEMIDKLEWEHWVQYMYGATVMRMIECDRQSRAQGRLVKAITLIDVGGVSVSMLNCPQWHKQNHRDIGTFQEHIAAEVFGEVCILNTPWLVMRLYDVVSVFIPERFRRKVRLLRGDGTDDPAFVALAGGIDQLRQLLAVRHSLFESPPHAGVAERSLFSTRRVATVSAGQEFALSVDVAPGQHIAWSFEVLPGRGDQLLGAPEVHFGIDAMWIPARRGGAPEHHRRLLAQLQAESAKEVLLEGEPVVPARGLVSGSIAVTSAGIVWLRWGNADSVIRRKKVSLTVRVSADAAHHGCSGAGCCNGACLERPPPAARATARPSGARRWAWPPWPGLDCCSPRPRADG